jgi:Arc/MetJ-type ribon-helix-helix transcriptional regulator
MKQVLLELDDELAMQLQKVVPARSRGRSEFIRNAIRKALWEREEAQTAAAYRAQPDSPEDAYLDPQAWEHNPRPTRRARAKSRAR